MKDLSSSTRIVLAVTALLVTAAIVIFLTAVLSSGGSESQQIEAIPQDPANATPRFTAISLLAGGKDKSRIDSRAFEIIRLGVPWKELPTEVFPGSELELVMILQEELGLTIGLNEIVQDNARVEALWKEMGQEGRKRPIYLLPIGDLRNRALEVWLRNKLIELGFQVTTDRSKATEHILFTVIR
jgi:hypothetical protein